jgi:hypothetical protein
LEGYESICGCAIYVGLGDCTRPASIYGGKQLFTFDGSFFFSAHIPFNFIVAVAAQTLHVVG